MSDREYRQILEPLGEVRSVVPPGDVAGAVIGSIRQTIIRRRRRRIIRGGVAVGALAAMLLLGFIRLNRPKDVVAPVNTPLVELQHAVDTSNAYRGVVQVSLEQIRVDAQGEPSAPVIAAMEVNTMTGATANRDLSMQGSKAIGDIENQLRDRFQQKMADNAIVVRPPANSTILIPLTWGAKTVPVPAGAIPPTIAPYMVSGNQPVTMQEQKAFKQFLIDAPSVGRPTDPRRATVWVDRSTGLVDQVQFKTRQNESTAISNIRYRYLERISILPPATAPQK